MADKWIEPNAEQQTQAMIVQHEIIEAVNRLIGEGIDARVVIAGLGSATADVLTVTFGRTAVAPWFDKQASMVRAIMRAEKH